MTAITQSRLGSPLFQGKVLKHAGSFRRSQLDQYDSDLTRHLMDIHDAILNNPVRDFNPMEAASHRQYLVYTLRALRTLLMPHVAAALTNVSERHNARKTMRELTEDALTELNRADIKMMHQKYREASAHCETAFAYLHDAIEVVRVDTRKAERVQPRKVTE